MVYKHAYLNTFSIYAQCGEDAAKRGGWRPMHKIVMETTLLIMENHGIVFLNFCGNLEIIEDESGNGLVNKKVTKIIAQVWQNPLNTLYIPCSLNTGVY